MPRLERIRDRLPSLYRPEDGSTTLVSELLRAVAGLLEETHGEATNVLQSHWFQYADRALFGAYFNRGRELQGLIPPRLGDLVDLVDPAHVAETLRDAADPLSAYLRSQFAATTQALLRDYTDAGAPPELLQRALIDELNAAVKRPDLYEAARFDHVELSPSTQELLSRDPQGSDRVRLHLLLLQEAYPGAISHNVLDLPYINDLGRLSALVALAPWYEPPSLRETVEPYRTRISRIVRLYRSGLGTTAALRSMVEAQLPIDVNALLERRDRPFWLEEFAPLVRHTPAIPTRGAPEEMVGPLMRWSLTNDGIAPAVPTVYIQGVAPQSGLIDATLKPLIELYRHGTHYPRLGIAYDSPEPLEPGQTLRLRPAYASWVGTDTGVQRAMAQPDDTRSADPTAPGPWEAVPGAPEQRVTSMVYTHDKSLWVATNAVVDGSTVGTLWRFDGQTWEAVFTAQPELYGLAENGLSLLVGTATGLLRIALYPGEGMPLTADTVPALAGQTVYVIYQAADGQLWLGTDRGAATLRPAADAAAIFDVQPSALQGTPIYAITQDKMGTFFFGSDHGLFQYQPLSQSWYWYAGKEYTENTDDWQTFSPGTLPTDEQVYIPPVHAVLRGPDESLWLGTDRGMARYIAGAVRGLTYRTLLEAFPDLGPDRVDAIHADERGLVWFCTERGLFRYDGRDWWQFQAPQQRWEQLGRADRLYRRTPAPEPRGAWRYDRGLGQWQRWRDDLSDWQAIDIRVRSEPESAVRQVVWTDDVVADIGTWDGTVFTASATVDVSSLVVHYKPSEQRIVNGGIPALPRMPVGTSVWRYLSLEPEVLEAPSDLPAWTVEGRLLPPPPAFPEAPGPGRFDIEIPPPASDFDAAVFAYNPAARVWFAWEPRRPLSVVVRLQKRHAAERLDEALLDRVWQGIQQVRPAGIRAMLAVEEDIVRGADHG